MAYERESEPPLLMISDATLWTEKEKQSIYNVTENRFQSLNLPLLLGKEIQCSSYGWLVLVSSDATDDMGRRECCLFNPVSMDTIALPDLNQPAADTCILSKPPTEPDCHVLFNSCHKIQQCFCRVGDHEFVDQPIHVKDGHARQLRAMGSFEGKIYGLIMEARNNLQLVTIHFVDKTLEFRPVLGTRPWKIPILSPPWSLEQLCNLMWLVESPEGDGGGVELLLVQKTYSCKYLNHTVEFRVFRIDMNKMEFVELQSIGERAIFISNQGSVFCRRSFVGLQPNSIYYTNQYGRNLYVFDLEDRSTTSMLPSFATNRKSITSWVEHSSCHTLFSN